MAGYQWGLESMDKIQPPNTHEQLGPRDFQLCHQSLPLLRRAVDHSRLDDTDAMDRLKRAFDDALYHFETGGFGTDDDDSAHGGPANANGRQQRRLRPRLPANNAPGGRPPVQAPVEQVAQQGSSGDKVISEDGRKRVAVAVSILEGKTDKTGLTPKVFESYDRYVDSAGVMAESVRQSMKDSKFKVDLIAFVMRRDYLRRYHGKLKAFGFKVIEAESPVLYNEIAPSYYKDELNKSGCCGMSELLKLNALTLDQYHRVMLVDADVIVLKNVDELFSMPDDIGLIYTNGTMDGEIYQGGMWIVRPNLKILEGMKDLIRRGAWYRGTAWEGTGIGWLYGGPTIQGLVPYWYWKKEGPGRYKEVDRCTYNNQNAPPCTDFPLEKRKVFHFTSCPKPFHCSYQKDHPGCAFAFDKWWEFSALLEKRIGLEPRPVCKQFGKYKPIKLNK